MIQLPNGCRCSEPKIHGSTLEDVWYIHYRFYDDKTGEKLPVAIKGGMNRLKTLKERNAAAKEILKATKAFLDGGANPIKKEMSPVDSEIHPLTPLLDALQIALEGVDCEKNTRIGLKSTLKFLASSLRALNLDSLPISQLTRKQAVMALNHACKRKSPQAFNRYRKNFGILCRYLVELMALDSNPIRDISKKSTTYIIKETLSHEQRRSVDRHLKSKGLHSFRLFIRVFFTSGARITELLQVKAQDVNLKEQWFLVTIKKGKNKRQVRKTIRNSALEYWRYALRNAEKNDYVFAKGLVPGKTPITAAQVTRRWEVHVKEGLGITAGLYGLKHSATTETVDSYGTRIAADQNSHTTDAMVVNIYDVKGKDRRHEELKKVRVVF